MFNSTNNVCIRNIHSISFLKVGLSLYMKYLAKSTKAWNCIWTFEWVCCTLYFLYITIFIYHAFHISTSLFDSVDLTTVFIQRTMKENALQSLLIFALFFEFQDVQQPLLFNHFPEAMFRYMWSLFYYNIRKSFMYVFNR